MSDEIDKLEGLEGVELARACAEAMGWKTGNATDAGGVMITHPPGPWDAPHRRQPRAGDGGDALFRSWCNYPKLAVSTAARKGCKCRRCWMYRRGMIDKDMNSTYASTASGGEGG